jgi:hypothetical protein
MSDEERIRDLLVQILESKRTPEEVCAADIELLPKVRARWERLQRVGDQVDELFPSE